MTGYYEAATVLCAGALLTFRLQAQTPSIAANGVFNTASYAYAGLPNSAIAQGSLFVVFGSNMGPATLQQALATFLAEPAGQTVTYQ